jgi:4-hydroxybenzoyl-CoA thioesterase
MAPSAAVQKRAALAPDPGPERAQAIPSSDLPAAAFLSPKPIRFSDCDPAGIVYTARFVDIMNGVLEDFFSGALGLSYHDYIRSGVGLGYAKADCDFFRPGMMGDALVFSVLVDRIGNTAVTLAIHGHRGEEEVVRGRFVLVTTSLRLHRPIPIPAELRSALVDYQDRCR